MNLTKALLLLSSLATTFFPNNRENTPLIKTTSDIGQNTLSSTALVPQFTPPSEKEMEWLRDLDETESVVSEIDETEVEEVESDITNSDPTPPVNNVNIDSSSSHVLPLFAAGAALRAAEHLTKDSTATSPQFLQLKEVITIGRANYQIETKLPLNTSAEQKELFKTAFRDEILKRIIEKDSIDTKKPFNVSFPKEAAFSVTPKDQKEIVFDLAKDVEAAKKIGSVREILLEISKTDPSVQVNLDASWKNLAPPQQAIVTKPVEKKSKVNAPFGMRNQGNDCWAIAMLHLILSSKPTCAWIEKEETQKDPKVGALTQFYRSYRTARVKTPRPKQVDSPSGAIRDMLFKGSGSTQQDIQEGLDGILKQMPDAPTLEITAFYEKDPSIHSSSEKSNYTKIQLPPDQTNCDLTKSMKNHFDEPFEIAKEQKIHIAGVQEEVSATRIIRAYEQPPEELWIHLNRFNGDLRSKNMAPVTIPQKLTIPMKDGTTRAYKLNAIANHLRESNKLSSGHYTAERLIDGQWYDCNDETVTEISRGVNEDITSNEAYVLHYELVTSP
jgi:ubiquitin C-terminal hydrolase